MSKIIFFYEVLYNGKITILKIYTFLIPNIWWKKYLNAVDLFNLLINYSFC